MLKLYSFFHLNLMYSSIEESSRPEVIYKCYWPLLKLAEIAPIGIEAPALTLEIINEIDPVWINKLKELINTGKVEFIGSGYSQIIGPLVPAKVNDWNQKLGLEVYGKLLGVRPKVALVNEMAYSGGIVEHYINVGYEGLIMEWNNPRSAHPEWENEWRYYPQKAIGADGRKIPLIWADSIAFQKFQRYVHGEYDLGDFVDYIKKQIDEQIRFFPLYSNDVEIFDYRPGRFNTEARLNNSEWNRIYELYDYLGSQNWCTHVFPGDLLMEDKHLSSCNSLKLESPPQPIPVKKQEKYNINRWALTGRNDIGINTKCYNIYHSILRKEKEIQEEWRELCYLWSSDFRTHITPRRWKHFLERLDQSAQNYLNSDDIALGSNATYYNGNLKKCKYYENDNIAIEFNYSKGSSIKNLSFKSLSDIPLITTLDHGYYDDISLGADFYSGHAIIERPAKCKITDLSPGYIKTEERESCFRLEYRHENDSAAFCTRYVIEHDRINIFKEIIINDDIPAIIHPLNFTFNPDAWDKSSLYIETNNGGGSLERFYLNNKFITHNDIYSMQISARHGFGCTGGYLVIGDKAKSILFSNDMAAMALIPTILYKEIDDQIFFRLKYSAGEIDETRKVDNPIQSIISSIYISLVFEQGRLRNGFSI